jgi:hypothetical protein
LARNRAAAEKLAIDEVFKGVALDVLEDFIARLKIFVFFTSFPHYSFF